MSSLVSLAELEKNPNARVIVAFKGSDRVKGFVQGDFGISVGSDYTTLFDPASTDKLNLTATRIKTAVQNFTGFDTSKIDIGIKNTAATQNLWLNTTRPRFRLELTFVATKDSDDVRRTVINLYETVLPRLEPRGKSFSIFAPLNYLPTGPTSARGTVTVQVGKWFRATRQNMINVSFTFSKEVIASGFPLYATGSIEFEPFRVIGLRDLEGYLVGLAKPGSSVFVAAEGNIES